MVRCLFFLMSFFIIRRESRTHSHSCLLIRIDSAKALDKKTIFHFSILVIMEIYLHRGCNNL
jgi:hypothetical protein